MRLWYTLLIPVVVLGLHIVRSRQPFVLFLGVVVRTVLLCSGLGMIGLKLKAYMVFIVYVGGLFVLFGYMVSLISMDLERRQRVSGVPVFRGIFLLLLWIYDVGEIKSLGQDFNISSSRFGGFNGFLVVGLALVLLVVMVAAVKISEPDKGCLRHGLDERDTEVKQLEP